MIKWAQRTTENYPGCKVTDLTSSWRDGLAFNAVIHRNRPDLIDYRACHGRNNLENLEHAFMVAERDLGITRLLDPEDVDVLRPDEKSMITYLAQLYELFPDPTDRNPLLDAEKIRRIDEFRELAHRLLRWICDTTIELNERKIPSSMAELSNLKLKNKQFKLEEIPAKAYDKQRLCSIIPNILSMANEVGLSIEPDLYAESIEQHWEQMLKSHKSQSDAIDDEISKLTSAKILHDKMTKATGTFQLKLDLFKNELDDMDRKLDMLKPVNIDHTNMQNSIYSIQPLTEKLKELNRELNDLSDEAEGLIDKKLALDPKLMRSGIRDCQSYLTKLENATQLRLEEIEKAVRNLEEQAKAEAEKARVLHEKMTNATESFQHKLDIFKNELDDMEQKLDLLEPVNIDHTNMQNTIDSMQPITEKLEELNIKSNNLADEGENLISKKLALDSDLVRSGIEECQSHLAKLEDTAQRRLEEIDRAVRDLEEQAKAEAERARVLHERMTNATGTFQLKLDSFKNELDDMDHKLDLQKPVNIDHTNMENSINSMQPITEKLEEFKIELNNLTDEAESLISKKLAIDPKLMRSGIRECQSHLAKLEDAAQRRLEEIENALRDRENQDKAEAEFEKSLKDVMDWLNNAEQVLNSEENVCGDLDTVNSLFEQHKAFQEELASRQPALDTIKKMESKLLNNIQPGITGDNIRKKSSSVLNKWKDVKRLCNLKSDLLKEALAQATEFHNSIHALLEWLAEAEMKLRFSGPSSDDESICRHELEEHDKFLAKLAIQAENKDKLSNLARNILSKCHPDADPLLKHWINILQSRWDEIDGWAQQRSERLNEHLNSLLTILSTVEKIINYLSKQEARLLAEESIQPTNDKDRLETMLDEHQNFMDELRNNESEIDKVIKIFATTSSTTTSRTILHSTTTKSRPDSRASSGRFSGGGSRSTTPTSRTSYATYRDDYPEVKQPRVRVMLDKWRSVWQLSIDKMQRLTEHGDYLNEVERLEHFNFDEWRTRFLHWMSDKKGRVMDFYRSIDKDNDGRISIADFQDGLLRSKFKTSRLELERVVEVFDKNNDGVIDNKEYLDTLRPDKPVTDDEVIQDEVQRQVCKCTCVQRYKVYHVGEGRYRFGESQKLRLVRILRSKVMVRVGGGWEALEEFLQKNDPCRTRGRTNVELREQFILPEGATQAMVAFRSKMANISSSSTPGSSIPTSGPVTKIREKTDRSMPMSGTSGSGLGTTSRTTSGSGSGVGSSGTPNRFGFS